MKWVVDQLGIDEVRRRVLKVRHTLPASSSWPGGIPEEVAKAGDAPAGVSTTIAPDGRRPGRVRRAHPARPVRPLGGHQRDPRPRPTARSRPSPTPRSATSRPTSSARSPRSSVSSAPTCASSNRQNVVFRGLTEAQLPVLFERLETIGMARPGAELSRDVVACPGADTCNIAVTQSRGLAKAIGERLEEEGLAEVGGVRINISGCTNSCGQHHIADIGFFGAERRAHGKSAPGYQMLLGGYVGQEQATSATRRCACRPRTRPEAAARVVRRFTDERSAGEAFRTWMDACRRGQGDRRRPARPRRVPGPRRAPRVLRRLRRDRSVQRRDRRVGVRRLSAVSPHYAAAWRRSTTPTPTDPNGRHGRAATDEPLALAHGRLAAEWIDRLVADADDALLPRRPRPPPAPVGAAPRRLSRRAAPATCAGGATRSNATPPTSQHSSNERGYDAGDDRAGAGADPARGLAPTGRAARRGCRLPGVPGDPTGHRPPSVSTTTTCSRSSARPPGRCRRRHWQGSVRSP